MAWITRYDVAGGGWQICSRFFVLTCGRGTVWFRLRLFGRLAPGLTVTDIRRGFVPFSVRYGFERPLKIGPYHIASIGWSPV